MQEFTSANTSLNQIPALHKNLVNKNLFGDTNFDMGAGKFDTATNFLARHEILNIRYDKYNLPEKINTTSYRSIGICDTATIANVLNVIKEESEQIDVLKHTKRMLKNGGVAYISVYEGNKIGIGNQSKNDCWQNNKKLIDYLPTIQKVFSTVYIKYGMIIAKTY